jgi:hypothetical protein
LRIVASEEDREGIELDLDAICRDGARKMLQTALRAEVAEYIQAAGGAVDGGSAVCTWGGKVCVRTFRQG